MKHYIFILLIVFGCAPLQKAHAQAQELQQLILDIEKLAQLKSILKDLYKGYEIITKGYNTIKDLSEGNFNLHKTFLDGLMDVSPTVKKYARIGEIISCQQQLVKEYKSAFSNFQSSIVFGPDELDYLQQVYTNLFSGSLKDLDELLMVITANQLRMNDAERMNAIDRVYADMADKLEFLRHFNNKTALLEAQKLRTLNETQHLQSIYGTKN
jgi:DNA repair ATPase RecN